jgi:PPOX class probable F420-dependent enzyme
VPTLRDVVDLAQKEHFLAVVSTVRADGTIQASVVNAGVLPHPVDHEEVVGFVTYGPRKLANLRRRPQVSVTYRACWSWLTVEGRAEIVGPDDPAPAIDEVAMRRVLREVFSAAGGTHDDWDQFDATMRAERRSAVFVRPSRIYSNPSS